MDLEGNSVQLCFCLDIIFPVKMQKKYFKDEKYLICYFWNTKMDDDLFTGLHHVFILVCCVSIVPCKFSFSALLPYPHVLHSGPTAHQGIQLSNQLSATPLVLLL